MRSITQYIYEGKEVDYLGKLVKAAPVVAKVAKYFRVGDKDSFFILAPYNEVVDMVDDNVNADSNNKKFAKAVNSLNTSSTETVAYLPLGKLNNKISDEQNKAVQTVGLYIMSLVKSLVGSKDKQQANGSLNWIGDKLKNLTKKVRLNILFEYRGTSDWGLFDIAPLELVGPQTALFVGTGVSTGFYNSLATPGFWASFIKDMAQAIESEGASLLKLLATMKISIK